jgi:hypothetical protein
MRFFLGEPASAVKLELAFFAAAGVLFAFLFFLKSCLSSRKNRPSPGL